ncbi:MAG: alginate lyase family protein, partial [Prevotella sp.]
MRIQIVATKFILIFTSLLCCVRMQVYSQIDQLPTTFLINPAVLSANKLKINEADKELGHILSKVVLLAEEAMDNGPYSVTYKEKTPPSGDKRDYMSVGPYWWPDSTKSNGLPYIRRDGIVNPERYKIQDAEFFKSVCSDLFLLSLTEYFTGNKKYAEKAVDILKTWFLDEKTRMNPHLNYGQSIPGRTEGRGIGLIDTRSLVYLIDGIQILKTTGHLPNDTYEGIQIWFKEFLNWMITSEIGLDEADEHNNHGTYYDV